MRKTLATIYPLFFLYRKISLFFYKFHFRRDCYSCHYGVFNSYDEAIRNIPTNKPSGYDNKSLAQQYEKGRLGEVILQAEQINQEIIPSFEYPVLFFLSNILKSNKKLTVFDFGGNVGTHFYRYLKILDFSNLIHWIIGDVPEILSSAKSLSTRYSYIEEVKYLSFLDTSQMFTVDADIFISSGAIQYIFNDISPFLEQVRGLKHIVLNRVPTYKESFFSIQNGGIVYYPTKIFQEETLIEEIQTLGFSIRAVWSDDFDHGIVPAYPDNKNLIYRGYYFAKE